MTERIAISSGPTPRRFTLTSGPPLFFARAAIVAAFLLAWELASGPILSAVWFSSPTRIAWALVSEIADGTLWYHLQATILTVVLGYGVGVIAGVILGFILGLLPWFENVLGPFIAALWCLPKIALLPLFVIFLGLGIESKVALVASVVVFLVLYSTIDGVRDVDPDLVDSLKLMGATNWEILVKVLFPASLPWIYTGLRVSISYALTTTVVGELLSSNRGLGFLMESASARFDASSVFASVVALVALSLVITNVVGRVEAHSSRWRA